MTGKTSVMLTQIILVAVSTRVYLIELTPKGDHGDFNIPKMFASAEFKQTA